MPRPLRHAVLEPPPKKAVIAGGAWSLAHPVDNDHAVSVREIESDIEPG